jgi:hypothetical protein
MIQASPPSGNAATDTANLKAALTDALPSSLPVELGHGDYLLNDTLHIGDPGPNHRGGGLVGPGVMATRLTWQGADGGTMLYLDHLKYGRLEGLALVGTGRTRGVVGIEIGRSGGLYNGTMSNGIELERIAVDNCKVGIQIGRNGSASASEILLRRAAVSRCEVGINCETYNTLSIQGVMLELGQCGVGLRGNQAGSIHVFGGVCGGNDVDFEFKAGGSFGLYGGRSETTGRFLRVPSTTHGHLAVEVSGWSVTPSRNPDGVLIELGQAVSASISSSKIGGSIICASQYAGSSLTLRACGISDTVPFRAQAGKSIVSLKARVEGCMQLDVGGYTVGHFPDSVTGGGA